MHLMEIDFQIIIMEYMSKSQHREDPGGGYALFLNLGYCSIQHVLPFFVNIYHTLQKTVLSFLAKKFPKTNWG
jgi:hypothetical protein